MCWNKC